MAKREFPIPVKLNLAVAVVIVSLATGILISAGDVKFGWGLLGLAICYGMVMTSGYALMHEAVHGMFHPNPAVNDAAGIVLAAFFPAPYHLLLQGHHGHHMRNRSDDEAFDYYFEGENVVWKYMQLYGTMIGCFWIVAALSNFIAAFYPRMLREKSVTFDRPTEAFLEQLNPKYLKRIRIEAFAVIGLHLCLIVWFQIPPLHWLAVMFGFGFPWSAMQYVHHYGTERDVRRGAKNLRTFRLLDLLWLNHNWHLNHHMQPTVPWIYLPSLYTGVPFETRDGLLKAYLRMWRGPRLAKERVKNRYAGRLVK